MIDSGATSQSPSFIIQALTPWANAPQGGFDRAWELKGLIWQLSFHCTGHELSTTGISDQLYASTEILQAFSEVAGMFFVDQADDTGAPVSVTGTALGPFITTPPIANPAAAPADDEFMPTRVLRRKVGLFQTGATPSVSTGQSAYALGISNFRWSGTLRKRVSIASRQGLYLGFYGLPPQSTVPNLLNTINLIYGSVVYYYSLRR